MYGAGVGDPVELVVLGDSSAAGLGADLPEQTPGAVVARGLSAVAGKAVRLTTVAQVGAVSADLGEQLDRVLEQVPAPDIAIVMVGANDVTHRIKPAAAVRDLAKAVERLREAGCEVVVGTCPDLGTIEPVPQPLRLIARRLSRDLAAAQTVAAVEAGARSVSLGDLLGEEFRRVPHEMFSADRFHPSSAGYAAAAAAVLPSACAALGPVAGRRLRAAAGRPAGRGRGPDRRRRGRRRGGPGHRGQRHPGRRPAARPARPLGGAAAPSPGARRPRPSPTTRAAPTDPDETNVTATGPPTAE